MGDLKRPAGSIAGTSQSTVMAQNKKNYRRWAWISSGVAVALLGGVFGAWWWRSMGYVSTDDARIKAEIVSISTEIQGRIEALAKDEGESIARGEIMGRLDSREVQIQIQQAQAELDEEIAALRFEIQGSVETLRNLMALFTFVFRSFSAMKGENLTSLVS